MAQRLNKLLYTRSYRITIGYVGTNLDLKRLELPQASNCSSFQAIDILTRATRISPTTDMLILLGKTCMKAKQYENAIASFKRAVYNLVSTVKFLV